MPLMTMVRPNGPLIQKVREDGGLSRARLAKRIRRTRQGIWKAENKPLVSAALVRDIARGLRAELAAAGLKVDPETLVPLVLTDEATGAEGEEAEQDSEPVAA